jgi:hypothetical protein
MNTKCNVYIYVLFYSRCYTITVVLSIYTRGTLSIQEVRQLHTHFQGVREA